MSSIDGRKWYLIDTVTPSKGSGDNEEKFDFSVLETESSGPARWLLTDQGKWWLFEAPPQPPRPYKIATTHEVFEAQKVVSNGVDKGPCRFAWVSFEEPYTETEPPFQGTREGLVMTDSAGTRMMLSLPVMKAGPEEYYTPTFPVCEIPRQTVVAKEGLGSGKLLPHLTLLLAFLFGAAAFLDITAPVKLLWWLGPLAAVGRLFTARQSKPDHVLRLLSGVFFLDFVTHFVDNIATADWEEIWAPLFESGKMALICAGMWVLRLWKPRLHFSLLDGISRGGGCSWLVFTGVLAVVSINEEFNYFRFFDWYAGELPWAVLWLAAAIWAVWHMHKDYRRVPLDLRGFRSLLYRTADTLDQTFPVCAHKSTTLSEWADDLEDALSISADPLVASLSDYGPSFEAWREQAKNLKDVDAETLEPEVRERLEADLVTIASDFRDLVDCIDRWPASRGELKSLRRSPLLETWNH